MTLHRHPEPAIAAWLADGPGELSSPARRAISATIRTTSQRGAPVRWLPSLGRSRLAIAGIAVALALTLAIATGAVNLLVPQPTGSPMPAESPAPTQSTQRPSSCPAAGSASAGGRATIGVAGTKVWVDYCRSTLLQAHAGPGPGVVEFGSVITCDMGAEPVPGRGVVVADVSGARRHGSLVVQPPIGTDAQTFLRDLDVPLPYPPQALVIDFAVQDVAETRLAGMTAWSAAVVPNIVPWASHLELGLGSSDGCVELRAPNRVWVFDVGRSIVLVEAWAEDEAALAVWLPEATQLIDAFVIRADGPTTPFFAPPPSPSPAS